MLRLSMVADVTRRAVSERIVDAFHYLFGEGEEVDREKVAEFFKAAPHIDASTISWGAVELVALRLEEMSKDIQDQRYQYTFGGFGAFLLREILYVLAEKDWNPGEWGTQADRDRIRRECMVNLCDEDAAALEADGTLMSDAILRLCPLVTDPGYRFVLCWEGPGGYESWRADATEGVPELCEIWEGVGDDPRDGEMAIDSI